MKEFSIDMENLILHDIQLIKTQLVSLQCNIIDENKNNSSHIQTKISVNVKGIAIDEKSGYSNINVIIESDVFKFDIIYRGDFELNKEKIIEKDIFENFLLTQGVRILWSYVREIVFEISCKMLRKPLMLPTLDVMQTLKKCKEKDTKEE